MALAQGWDEVATMAARREASADWQERIEQHQARAHFAMQADKSASAAFHDGADENASRRSDALAKSHGQRLVDAMRGQTTKEALKEHPELASAYSTLASARAFAAAKLDPSQKETFVQRAADKVANDLANGRHSPQVDLKTVQEQIQRHDGPER